MNFNRFGGAAFGHQVKATGTDWHKGVVGRFAIIAALLMAGIGTGAVIGSVQAAQLALEAEEPHSTLAGVGDPDPVRIGGLEIEDSGRDQVDPQSTQAASPKATAKKPASGTAPAPSSPNAVYTPVYGQAPPATAVNCDRLDDKKIYWLLDLVAKTKAANPDQAAVADHIDAKLRAQLGQNICAEEAQIYIGAMCNDPGVRNFMHLMVKELPFFVRPMVGDPCAQDLVAAADRWL
ncbi:MAG: hypothetical protein WD602_02425 [Actinomycetota bacterium]